MNDSGNLAVPQHVMARQVGEECVILDLANGTYYGLDAVGARIWELLSEGATPEAICDRVVEEYEVGREQARADIASLIGSLRERGLVTGG